MPASRKSHSVGGKTRCLPNQALPFRLRTAKGVLRSGTALHNLAVDITI
jgi:hypothetical protein